MLVAHAKELLRQKKNVVNVATSDIKGRPNAAVKLLLKIDEHFIYLADYSMGTTWNNLKSNPRLSMSFEDVETSKGYRINGAVEVIEDGHLYEELVSEARIKETEIVVNRVIEGLQRNKRYKEHLITTSDRFVVYKVKIQKIVEFGPQGALQTEELQKSDDA